MLVRLFSIGLNLFDTVAKFFLKNAWSSSDDDVTRMITFGHGVKQVKMNL